jgi:hypothetical protein
MKKKISKEKIALYTSLQKLKPEVLGDVIQHLDDRSIDDLCECVYNVIHTDLSLTPSVKKKLRIHLKNCSGKNLKIITQKKTPVSKRRKALSQEGQGVGKILSAVVSMVLPFVIEKVLTKK